MTLGERLQQLRKEKQMSQEELGNLLLVSRQTVSLWENNQTVPTVDNLIRLKEIFGVSIDSILTDEKNKSSESTNSHIGEIPSNDSHEHPLEKYCFSLDKKELKYFYKISIGHLLKRLVLCVVFIFFSFFVTSGDTSEERDSYILVFLAFIFLFANLLRYIYVLLATKKNSELVCSRKYTYEMFLDYIIVRVANSNEEIKTQKLYLNELAKCWETPFCYFLQHKDRTIYTIKKSLLEEKSHLGFFCQNLKTDKTDLSTTKISFLKTIGDILFVGCFISVFLAAGVSLDEMSQNAGTHMENLESLKNFHYFLPIPLISIIAGILLNKNKIRNKKNIICGVIIGFIMLIYGFFPTIFGNVSNNIDSLEVQLGFDFPQTVGMNYNISSDISGGKLTLTTMSFEESTANDFEEFMQDDHRWIKGSNKDFTKIIPENLVSFPSDYFLLYNTTTSEFGKIPENDGQYQLIYVAYSSEFNVAYICEYQFIV